MSAVKMDPQGLTTYSRFVLYVLVLPLLFIAGVQLFILSAQTETYFAWTFTAPISAAYMGAGYWAAMLHAYSGARSRDWAFVRTSMGAALTATGLLTVTTFLHLGKFHLTSPLFITRFVTWVWIAVYVFVPPILAIAWIVQSRTPAAHPRAETPLPVWMRAGFLLISAFALFCGLGLFSPRKPCPRSGHGPCLRWLRGQSPPGSLPLASPASHLSLKMTSITAQGPAPACSHFVRCRLSSLSAINPP